MQLRKGQFWQNKFAAIDLLNHQCLGTAGASITSHNTLFEAEDSGNALSEKEIKNFDIVPAHHLSVITKGKVQEISRTCFFFLQKGRSVKNTSSL